MTGAGRGVGLGIARVLRDAGASLLMRVFLASREASWITRQTIAINGGSITT